MAIHVSNSTADMLTTWIEPWCDELTLPPRSVLSLSARNLAGEEALPPEIERCDDRLAIWAVAAGTLIATVDGIEQDTGCRGIELPAALFEIPVKSFVQLAFGGRSEARPTGAPVRFRHPVRSVWAYLRLGFKTVVPPWIRFNRRR